jgi:serine/threonine protein phosphatase PrpC
VKVRFAGATDVGRVRDHNEDCFGTSERHLLFVVADGMGGHEHGEVASKLAVDAVTEFFEGVVSHQSMPRPVDATLPFEANRLLGGIKLANRKIFAIASGLRKTMGTTIVAAHLSGSTMYVAHVGDSRAYLIRGDKIAQLTRDHSALEEFKQCRPNITEQEIRAFPYRNVIMRALGTLPDVPIDIRPVTASVGDVFLLCCDGLSNMVDDASILKIVRENADLDRAASTLIDAANAGGGDDNITVILIRCEA